MPPTTHPALPFEIKAAKTAKTPNIASLHFPHIRSIARGELEVFSSYQAMGQRKFPSLQHINPLLKDPSELDVSYPHLAVVATAVAKLSTELYDYLSQLAHPDAPRAHILPYVSKLILLIIRELDSLLPTHEAERTAENMRMTYVEAERANTNLQIGHVLQNTMEQDDSSSSLLRDTDTQHFTTISSLLTELVIRARNGKLNHLSELAAEQPANLQYGVRSLKNGEIDKLLNNITFSDEAGMYQNAKSGEDTRLIRINALHKLTQNSLHPHHEVTIGDDIFYLSGCSLVDISMNDPNRVYTILYVKLPDGQLIARPCTRSQSHGVWKFIPASTRTRHSKGINEDSIVLCPELQKAMTILGKPTLGKDVTDLITMIGKKDEFLPTHSFMGTQSFRPHMLGNFSNIMPSGEKRGGKLDPESAGAFTFFDLSDKPNFSKEIASWNEKIPLYGWTNFEVFSSHNGKYRYIFCRDEQKRAWLASIDVAVSPFSRSGIKSEWVNGGDLTTPAYEYPQNFHALRNSSSLRVGHEKQYADAFAPYVSNIPLIQEYLSSRALV